jgi:hypothetical protein
MMVHELVVDAEHHVHVLDELCIRTHVLVCSSLYCLTEGVNCNQTMGRVVQRIGCVAKVGAPPLDTVARAEDCKIGVPDLFEPSSIGGVPRRLAQGSDANKDDIQLVDERRCAVASLGHDVVRGAEARLERDECIWKGNCRHSILF